MERLQQDDTWVDNFLIWRDDDVDDALKMIDESFQWRKEYTVHGKMFGISFQRFTFITFETGLLVCVFLYVLFISLYTKKVLKLKTLIALKGLEQVNVLL